MIWINLALTWVKFLLKKSLKRTIAPYASFLHQIQLFSIASATAQRREVQCKSPGGKKQRENISANRQSHIHTHTHISSCRLGPRRFVPVLVCVTHTSWKWILQDHNVRNLNIEPRTSLDHFGGLILVVEPGWHIISSTCIHELCIYNDIHIDIHIYMCVTTQYQNTYIYIIKNM